MESGARLGRFTDAQDTGSFDAVELPEFRAKAFARSFTEFEHDLASSGEIVGFTVLGHRGSTHLRETPISL